MAYSPLESQKLHCIEEYASQKEPYKFQRNRKYRQAIELSCACIRCIVMSSLNYL